MPHSQQLTDADFERFRDQIATFPEQVRTAVAELTPARLGLRYREGGWTAAQVINHLADSHLNALVRIKLLLTEDNPTIRPYDQDGWASLADGRTEDVEDSLRLLEAVHRKLTYILHHVSAADRIRTYYHPEYDEVRSLDYTVSKYAEHGLHHLAQLRSILPAEAELPR